MFENYPPAIKSCRHYKKISTALGYNSLNLRWTSAQLDVTSWETKGWILKVSVRRWFVEPDTPVWINTTVDERIYTLINSSLERLALGLESSSKVHRVTSRSNVPDLIVGSCVRFRVRIEFFPRNAQINLNRKQAANTRRGRPTRTAFTRSSPHISPFDKRQLSIESSIYNSSTCGNMYAGAIANERAIRSRVERGRGR